MTTDRWLEINQIAIEHKLKREQAIELIEKAPGQWAQKIYHHCNEAPIGVTPRGDYFPFIRFQNEEGDHICPSCKEVIDRPMRDFILEPFKILPEGIDRDAIINQLLGNPLPAPEEDEHQQSLNIHLAVKKAPGDRKWVVLRGDILIGHFWHGAGDWWWNLGWEIGKAFPDHIESTMDRAEFVFAQSILSQDARERS
jgi:hypothetical protein